MPGQTQHGRLVIDNEAGTVINWWLKSFRQMDFHVTTLHFHEMQSWAFPERAMSGSFTGMHKNKVEIFSKPWVPAQSLIFHSCW